MWKEERKNKWVLSGMEDSSRKMKLWVCISILSVALLQHGSSVWLGMRAPPADGHVVHRLPSQSRSTVFCGSKEVMTKKAEKGSFLYVKRGFFWEATWESFQPKSLPRNEEDFCWNSHRRQLFITSRSASERVDSIKSSQYVQNDCRTVCVQHELVGDGDPSLIYSYL